MNELVVMVGAPASGKSTYIKNNFKGYKILSSDEIRKELFNDESSQENNALVFKVLYDRVKDFLTKGNNVVIDATSVSIKDRKKVLDNFKYFDIKRIAVYIKTPIEICYDQDKKRNRNVGKKVIDYFFSILEEPKIEEGFDEIKIVEYKKIDEN